MFEASGAPAALGGVLRATARGGTLVQVGNLPGTAVPAVLGDLVTREITWVGSYRFVEEITDALQALRDGLDVSPLITHTVRPGRRREALAVAADRTSGSSKVMLRLARTSAGELAGSVVTLGETMALIGRPRPAGSQAAVAAAGIGGAESNVAIGLARLDVPSPGSAGSATMRSAPWSRGRSGPRASGCSRPPIRTRGPG